MNCTSDAELQKILRYVYNENFCCLPCGCLKNTEYTSVFLMKNADLQLGTKCIFWFHSYTYNFQVRRRARSVFRLIEYNNCAIWGTTGLFEIRTNCGHISEEHGSFIWVFFIMRIILRVWTNFLDFMRNIFCGSVCASFVHLLGIPNEIALDYVFIVVYKNKFC